MAWTAPSHYSAKNQHSIATAPLLQPTSLLQPGAKNQHPSLAFGETNIKSNITPLSPRHTSMSPRSFREPHAAISPVHLCLYYSQTPVLPANFQNLNHHYTPSLLLAPASSKLRFYRGTTTSSASQHNPSKPSAGNLHHQTSLIFAGTAKLPQVQRHSRRRISTGICYQNKSRGHQQPRQSKQIKSRALLGLRADTATTSVCGRFCNVQQRCPCSTVTRVAK